MAYPAGVILRPVTFGPAFELEDGGDAGMTVAIKATRAGMLWRATGQPGISNTITASASDGLQQTLMLPVTDQVGWGDGDGNALIPGDDGHVFLYTVSVKYTQDGRDLPGGPRSKNVPIPTGDLSPLDLDDLISLTTPGGSSVAIPDIWSELIEQAQAAAVAAEAAVIDSDTFVASRITDPASDTATALSAKIVEGLADIPAGKSGAERLVAADLVGMPSVVVAAAGDSTIDLADEWLGRGLQKWAIDHGRACTFYFSYGDTGPYQSSVLNPEWVDYYRDEFARSGDIYGSTPDAAGSVYTGTAGGWTGDGARAVSSGNNAWLQQDAGAGAVGGRRRAVLDIDINTAGGATDKFLTLELGTDTNNMVIFELKITTAGAQVWSIAKRVAGSTTFVAAGSGNPLTVGGAASAQMVLEVSAAGLVTGKLGSLSVTGQLSTVETAAIVAGAHTLRFRTFNAASAGTAIRRAYAQTGTPAGTLTVYNGSKAGSTLANYALDKIPVLYPAGVSIDLLIVSSSHNYLTIAAADYLAALDAFISAYRALHPESGILITSQNPEYAPIVVANIEGQRARNAALRQYATERGYGYLPIAETWAAKTDVSKWIQSDGVHPTRVSEFADPDNASYAIMNLLTDYLKALATTTAQGLTSVVAGTGLTGGGSGTGGAVTLSTAFGAAAGTSVEGNDPRLGVNLIAAGQETFSRHLCNGSGSMTTASMRLSYFTARNTTPINSLRLGTANTAAAATPTLVRLGIYSVAGDGALTLVASTASDTALFATANTSYTKALSSTFTPTKGQRYAVGVLVVSSAAVPTLTGNVLANGNEMAIEPRLSGLVGGQSDLPTTVAGASVSASPAAIYTALVP